MTLIQSLIDKQDTFEIVRDQIAAILALETVSQQTLATTAGKDADLWKFKVYKERANPWEAFRDVDSGQGDDTPIVNVWYESSNFDKSASDTVERQKSNSSFNIDCYGYGASTTDGATGQVAGDEAAALATQRTVRLVRNILMAGINTYLQLPRGTVWLRWPNSINIFQPQIGENPVERVIGARISLDVSFSEFSPQVEGEIIELLSVAVSHGEDGLLTVNADYEYPLNP